MINSILTFLGNDYYRFYVCIYVLIISGAVIFAFISQKKIVRINIGQNKNKIQGQLQRFYFVLSFAILWFFAAFADCGTDRESYRNIFENVVFSNLFDGWQEPGFVLFNLVFRILGDNPWIILIAISTVTLLLLYSTMYHVREEIVLGYAVLSYGTLFFAQSLSLMRMYMAATILFFGIRYLRKNQYVYYIIVVLIATMIHYSSLVMILPMLLIFFLYHKRYEFMLHLLLVVAVLCLGLILVVECAPILSQISIFSRFQRYLEDMKFSGIGMLQFVYNIPICFLVLGTLHNMDENRKRIACSFTVAHFFICIMSYIIPVLGRAVGLFSILYMYVLPYCFKIVNEDRSRGKISKKVFVFIHISAVLYYILRFLIYMNEYAFLDGIIPYKNILL